MVYKSFGFLNDTNESNSYSNMSNRTKWQNLSSVSGAAVALLNYSAKTEQFDYYCGADEFDEEVEMEKIKIKIKNQGLKKMKIKIKIEVKNG